MTDMLHINKGNMIEIEKVLHRCNMLIPMMIMVEDRENLIIAKGMPDMKSIETRKRSSAGGQEKIYIIPEKTQEVTIASISLKTDPKGESLMMAGSIGKDADLRKLASATGNIQTRRTGTGKNNSLQKGRVRSAARSRLPELTNRPCRNREINQSLEVQMTVTKKETADRNRTEKREGIVTRNAVMIGGSVLAGAKTARVNAALTAVVIVAGTAVVFVLVIPLPTAVVFVPVIPLPTGAATAAVNAVDFVSLTPLLTVAATAVVFVPVNLLLTVAVIAVVFVPLIPLLTVAATVVAIAVVIEVATAVVIEVVNVVVIEVANAVVIEVANAVVIEEATVAVAVAAIAADPIVKQILNHVEIVKADLRTLVRIKNTVGAKKMLRKKVTKTKVIRKNQTSGCLEN